METKRALVCSPKMPEFDREGGSRRVFHLIEFFQEAGWAVSFMAQNASDGERYARVLQQKGVPVYVIEAAWPGGEDCLVDPAKLIAAANFDIAVTAFWYVAELLIPIIRSGSPKTRIVADSIDLHFLRESRSILNPNSDNGSSGTLDSRYALDMIRELNAYAESDAVLTVSQKEADLVNDFVNEPSHAYPLALMEDLPLSPLPFDERKGILYVGNFRHLPNTEAIKYFCHEVLPLIDERILAEHPVYVVGNELEPDVVELGELRKYVQFVGWVPSLLPYFQKARISVVPLPFGAGTKTKLIQSLTVGTPSVSTTVGIEGLDLEHGEQVLVADNAVDFANAIEHLLESKEMWQRLAVQGRAHITGLHGRDAVYNSFKRVLSAVMQKEAKQVAAPRKLQSTELLPEAGMVE
jgi:glycosyltransferase involved in cell wall biosynthesis